MSLKFHFFDRSENGRQRLFGRSPLSRVLGMKVTFWKIVRTRVRTPEIVENSPNVQMIRFWPRRSDPPTPTKQRNGRNSTTAGRRSVSLGTRGPRSPIDSLRGSVPDSAGWKSPEWGEMCVDDGERERKRRFLQERVSKQARKRAAWIDVPRRSAIHVPGTAHDRSSLGKHPLDVRYLDSTRPRLKPDADVNTAFRREFTHSHTPPRYRITRTLEAPAHSRVPRSENLKECPPDALSTPTARTLR